MNIDITTHNGILTVKSVATGEHRTFKISTAKWADGKRVIALLSGSDNTSSYTGFGFVNDWGIKVWSKKVGTIYEKYADMIERINAHQEAGKVEVNFEGHCRRCNRLLTTPESVASGIGPVCANLN